MSEALSGLWLILVTVFVVRATSAGWRWDVGGWVLNLVDTDS